MFRQEYYSSQKFTPKWLALSYDVGNYDPTFSEQIALFNQMTKLH